MHAQPDHGKEKLEVGGNVQGLYELGPGKFGSEAVYIPRVPGTESEEDDGYLVLFAHDENAGYHLSLHTWRVTSVNLFLGLNKLKVYEAWTLFFLSSVSGVRYILHTDTRTTHIYKVSN